MNNQKDQLVKQSPAQRDTNLCDPRDFEVVEAGETPKMRTPFHNQCGSSEAEYLHLLREGAKRANASDFDENAAQHPNVNNAGAPRTKGIGHD